MLVIWMKAVPTGILEIHGQENEIFWPEAKLDPCLLIGDTVIAILYVDDVLMWSTRDQDMTDLGILLNKNGVDIEEARDRSLLASS